VIIIKKGIGGGLDVLHSFIVVAIAMFLISHALGGGSLSPLFLILLAIVLIILEIMGIVA